MSPSLPSDALCAAEDIGKANKETITNEVTVTANAARSASGPYQGGVVSGWSASASAEQPDWTAYQNLWKRADTKAEQPVFKKNIDVTYFLGEEGDAANTIKLTFKKDGAVAFAGKVGGTSVIGSSQLVWGGGALGESALPDRWYLTIYAPAKKGFDGWCATYAVELTFNAQGGVTDVEASVATD